MKTGICCVNDRIIPVLSAGRLFVDLDKVAASLGFHGFPVSGVRWIRALCAGDPVVGAIASAARRAADLRDPAFVIESPDAGAVWLPPVPDSRQIIAVGLNYRSHCAEQGLEPPREPRFFAKLVSSMTGHMTDVRLPTISDCIDYEGELAVVIGRTACCVPEDNALDHVYGYTIVNDVTARDLQKSDQQWTRAKGMDTFCPIGPFVTTADEIENPDDLRIVTTVNGTIRQDCRTSDMFFGVAAIISILSRAVTLEPGDIISTGTGSGVGVFMNPPQYLRDGDCVSISVEGLGTLTNVSRSPSI